MIKKCKIVSKHDHSFVVETPAKDKIQFPASALNTDGEYVYVDIANPLANSKVVEKPQPKKPKKIEIVEPVIFENHEADQV